MRINTQIKSEKIRLIDSEGNQLGVVNLLDGLKKADDVGLDLVEISPTINPPVCKILDYGKYLYEKQKMETFFVLEDTRGKRVGYELWELESSESGSSRPRIIFIEKS